METRSFQRFCPVCKLGNDADAITCRHCGASLGETFAAPTTRQVEEKDTKGLKSETREKVSSKLVVPSEGMAIFVLNKTEPLATRLENEFVLGRTNDASAEVVIDLTSVDGFALGVSRRHALVRSTGKGYVIIDLNSSNGTWLNGQRLMPTRPYDMPAESVIQLGRLKLTVSYQNPPKKK